ncbi:hypothetical protein KAI87_01550, partial [Myxococcota bacterium]|nr:hypothetical protein [Myxococcota bacterium]
MTIRSDSFCVSLKKMQGLSDSQLLSLADDIFVMDVLPELLHYIQKRAPISVRDVVQASSLPNLLTLAYLVRALKDGLLKRKKSGLMLAADLELADEVPVEELLSSSPALSLQGQARLSLLRELMAEHGDLRENMKILAFGDNEALEPLSTQESLQISRVSAVNTATNTE